MNVKPGYWTTEFWTHIIGGAVGILAMAGVITPAQASQAVQACTSIMGGLVVIASIFSYVQSRTQVKNGAAAAQAKAALANAYTAPPAPQVTVQTPPGMTVTNGTPVPTASTSLPWPHSSMTTVTTNYPQRDPANSLPDSPPAPQYGPQAARSPIRVPTTVGLIDPASANTAPSV